MKERLSKNGIPIQNKPTQEEVSRGNMYIQLVEEAVDARVKLDLFNWDSRNEGFIKGVDQLMNVYKRVIKLNFSTQIFSEVVNLKMRKRSEDGKKA